MHKKLYSIATLTSATIGGLATIIYNLGCQSYHPYAKYSISTEQPKYGNVLVTEDRDNTMADFCHSLFYFSSIGAFSTIVLSSFEMHQSMQNTIIITPEEIV